MAATTSFIKTSDPTILSELGSILGNFSVLLQATDDGKVGVREVQFLLRNLHLTPTGSAMNVTATNATSQDSLLGAESFDPQMSLRAIELYGKLGDFDTSMVELTFDPDTNISSPLYYANILGGGQVPILLAYAYLEFYSYFTASVEYQLGSIFDVSDVEITRIISNLRFISTVVGQVGDEEEVYKLLYVVRYMQRAILFIEDGISAIEG